MRYRISLFGSRHEEKEIHPLLTPRAHWNSSPEIFMKCHWSELISAYQFAHALRDLCRQVEEWHHYEPWHLSLSSRRPVTSPANLIITHDARVPSRRAYNNRVLRLLESYIWKIPSIIIYQERFANFNIKSLTTFSHAQTRNRIQALYVYLLAVICITKVCTHTKYKFTYNIWFSKWWETVRNQWQSERQLGHYGRPWLSEIYQSEYFYKFYYIPSNW